MLKDITGIRICGCNFEKPSELMIFEPLKADSNDEKAAKAVLLYGRNGAGKSTIAKGIKKCKGENIENEVEVEFLDKNANTIIINEEEKNRIFVFDEEFIDKKIKFNKLGLGTIVMFGKQVEIEKQLEDLRKKYKISIDEFENQQKVIEEYEDENNNKSPKYYLKQLKLVLQGDNNWAGRDKRIKNARSNSQVHSNTYENFISIKPAKERNELLIDFENQLNELNAARSGDEKILVQIPAVSLTYDEAKVEEILKLSIEKPILSEREKYLFNLIQTRTVHHLEDIYSTFSDDGVNTCPFCLQDVTDLYKNDLIQSVQKVLSKQVEEHQKTLKLLIINKVNLDLDAFSRFTVNVQQCNKLIDIINNNIEENNKIIQRKIDDPYTPRTEKIVNISSYVLELKEALNELESERTKYNEKISSTNKMIEDLTKINNEIAHYDIQENYLKLLASKTQLKNENDKLVTLQDVKEKYNREVNDLESKQKSVQIAIPIMNSFLKYIFFSENRFSIEYSDGSYKLLSNGKNISPSKLSQGERNIIGLCYFFVSILSNQDISIAYSKEYLLVIDDPVSSFDIENKVGIMSFLKYQLGKFLVGNINTKTLVMTHDLLTAMDIDKVFDELIKEVKINYKSNTTIHKNYQLKDNRLLTYPVNTFDEYSELMKIIYGYAIGQNDDYEIVIGNIMRQVLEAFSTFLYKKGIEEVTTDNTILFELGKDAYIQYFKNLMYRLLLNGGSHKAAQAKSTSKLDFFSLISKEEKQNTAKAILCFIYLLNKHHLLSHLNGCKDVEKNINDWLNNIQNSNID